MVVQAATGSSLGASLAAAFRLALAARHHSTSAASSYPVFAQPGPSRSSPSASCLTSPSSRSHFGGVRQAHGKAPQESRPEDKDEADNTQSSESEALAQSYDLLSQQLALQQQDAASPGQEEKQGGAAEEESYDLVTSQQRLIRGMAALHGKTTTSLEQLVGRLGGMGIQLESEGGATTSEAPAASVHASRSPRRPRLASSSPSMLQQQQRRGLHSTTKLRATHASSQGIDLSFPRHANPTPYDIFHLDERATASEVKRRYYDLVRHLHPDRRLGLSASKSKAKAKAPSKAAGGAEDEATTRANEEFKRVLAAYEILKDRGKREAYDRYGVGWGEGASSGGLGGFGGTGMRPPPGWGGGPGGAGGMPRTKSEWEAYHAWSDMLRRTASGAGSSRAGWEHRGTARGHDSFGWQSYAANPNSSQAFYGFYTSNRGEGPDGAEGGRQQPLYTSNLRFIGLLFLATWTVASIQYVRLSAQSARAVERADRKHMDAARSLDEARELARSKEGRKRWEEMRRRAREVRLIEIAEGGTVDGHENGELLAIEPSKALQAADGSPWGIGHGGPSGKEAYEAREAERKRREDARMGRA